ncbi:MAG: tRNA epoxyqueuosine(34) reductase QueG [Firmicutes bacterium]|jgi:epoxyqueuosine reductase|nr:tRNA epoxyqueuosine(34) reductase QueG [Bacillota bacterium]
MSPVNDLIDYSNQIGIEITGIIEALPLAGLKSFLATRARTGLRSPFENSSLSARIDPRLLLPGCQSIICLALPYFIESSAPRSDNEGPCGKVARIARFRDYHEIAKNKARLLVNFMGRLFPRSFQYRLLVDREPLMERAFAYQTDGIIGENTFFISHRYGSWVILGLILLDIPLPAWPPTTRSRSCLECGRCRKACPTGALYAPYLLDPRRCLSYVTQARGVVPLSFRESLGSRIYGCDTCQEVCPLNKEIPPSPLKEISAAVFDDHTPLIPLLGIDRREFSRTFGQTAAGWRGIDLIRRNAIIALGNSRDHRGLKPLSDVFTRDPQPLIRLHAAWSIGQLGGPEAERILSRGLERETDQRVQEEIRSALQGKRGEPTSTD